MGGLGEKPIPAPAVDFIERRRYAEEAVSRIIQAEHPGRLILGSRGRETAVENLRLLLRRWHSPQRGNVLSEYR